MINGINPTKDVTHRGILTLIPPSFPIVTLSVPVRSQVAKCGEPASPNLKIERSSLKGCNDVVLPQVLGTLQPRHPWRRMRPSEGRPGAAQ
jgi:hypothetical protein